MNGDRIVEWIKTILVLMEWIMDVKAIPLMDFLMHAAE